MEHLIYDCLIIGGGPASSAAAITLARQGRRVGVIHQPTESNWQIGESLPAAAKPALEQLGAEALLANGPHISAYGNASIWASEQEDVQDFMLNPLGTGWHLDRSRFDQDIRELAQSTGSDVWEGKAEQAERDGRNWKVAITAQKEPLYARTLIDATGRRSWLARQQGSKRHRDTTLISVHSWYESTQDDGMTRIEATADGWWYSAPIPDNKRVVAFHCDAQTAQQMTRSEQIWNQALSRTQRIQTCLIGVPLQPIRTTEACGAQTLPSIGDHWIAIGDAASCFDPIASQGITNALYTGIMGAKGIHQALEGNMEGLEEYASNLDKIRSSYLVQHTQTYYEVSRFAEQPFWKTRRSFIKTNGG